MHPMHTVLIDDDPISIFLTERVLLHEGLSDTAASFQSPTEALAFLLRQIPAGLVPQVILLDLNMPLIDGWDFLNLLQRHALQLQGQCVVFLLTSSTSPSDEARAGEHPLVAGLLHKPLEKLQIELIRDHLRSDTPPGNA